MSGDEFTAKCEAAALELDALADQHGYPNNTRLRGKAQGVRLALSYLRDYPTADAVLAVPAIADALAGCHAVTSDEGTSYCPLAEANAAAVARDAKVAEIVARQDKLVLDQAIGFIEIRSLYPDADDGWGVWAEDDIPATMLRDGKA